MSDNYTLMNALRLVSASGDITTLNEVGFTNTLAGINVQWQQINNLEIATSAVVAPDTANIFAVNDTFEANDNYLVKTRKAVLSAPPLIEPSLTLTNLTSGDNSVLTTQTLTLTEIANTNSAVLYSNGTLTLTDNGNGSVLSLTPDSGLGINVLPFPSSKYVNLDAYNGLGITDGTSNSSVSATQIQVIDNSTGLVNTINSTGYTTKNSVQNSTHFLNFSDNSSTGIGPIQKTAGISCNPSTNNISATTFNGATIGLTNSGVGYTSNPQLTLNNSNATAGNTTGVPSIELTKTGRNGAINDVIGSIFFNALDGVGVERTFGKIESTITSNTAPSNYDGALDFYSLINGVNQLVFRLNGADNENNSFRPLDMNGQDIKSSSGNMGISTASSSGTGNMTITAKGILTETGNSVAITSVGTAGDAITLTSAGNIDLNATGVVNINSNVVMDNSETLMIRNTANTIYNSQSQSQINMENIATATNTNQHLLNTTSQQLRNDQTTSANRIFTNNSDTTSTIITEYDTSIATDIKKSTLETNLVRMNDYNGGTTEQVDITPTYITFQSSGSTTDSLSFYNDSAGGGMIDWSNVSGTNGLAITSSHSLTLKSTTATYPIELDSDVINLKNTNTATSTINFNATLATTSSIGDITNYLKLQLNGADIWIPYFTSDPSV